MAFTIGSAITLPLINSTSFKTILHYIKLPNLSFFARNIIKTYNNGSDRLVAQQALTNKLKLKIRVPIYLSRISTINAGTKLFLKRPVLSLTGCRIDIFVLLIEIKEDLMESKRL